MKKNLLLPMLILTASCAQKPVPVLTPSQMTAADLKCGIYIPDTSLIEPRPEIIHDGKEPSKIKYRDHVPNLGNLLNKKGYEMIEPRAEANYVILNYTATLECKSFYEDGKCENGTSQGSVTFKDNLKGTTETYEVEHSGSKILYYVFGVDSAYPSAVIALQKAFRKIPDCE